MLPRGIKMLSDHLKYSTIHPRTYERITLQHLYNIGNDCLNLDLYYL
jgi:hypothetical protein